MEVFQFFKILATFSASLGADSTDLIAIRSETVGDFYSETTFHEKFERLTASAIEDLKKGDDTIFRLLWDSISLGGAPYEWTTAALQPLADAVNELRTEEAGDSPNPDPRWIPVYETILANTPIESLEDLEGITKFPAEHTMLAIGNGQGDELARWAYNLDGEKTDFYLTRLKEKNQLLKELRAWTNPLELDVELLDEKPRVGLVKDYLSHPFVHKISPFYGGLFSQLIAWKILAPEELFADDEGFVHAHLREGMAYLDLARVYRENERYEDALRYIDKGLTSTLLQGNRRGCYELEKTIILREAKKLDDAKSTFSEINHDKLDRSNRELYARIEHSLNN